LTDTTEQAPPGTITLFTIGFTGKSAEEFFTKLQDAGVRKVVDIRINNSSQLAGFTKKKDFPFFLCTIASTEYAHEPRLAPTKDILDDYKKGRISWDEYEERFGELMRSRRPAERYKPEDFDHACLLCTEIEPDRCHRRLVAEYFQRHWDDVNINVQHL
jgi:uncharacterized protein (DUF488 family)